MRKLRLVLLVLGLSVLAACQQGEAPSATPSEPYRGEGILDPQKGPAYTGYILGNDGKTPVKIQYQIVNGLAVYDGDIGIGPAENVAKTPEELRENQHNLSASALRDTRTTAWSNGVVPVRTVYNLTNLQAALNQIEQQVPGINFVTYTGQARYLSVEQGGPIYDGCSGGSTGKCTIRLPTLSASKAIIMHEVGHALGFAHEIKRCDRDNYIRMLNTSAAPAEFAKACDFSPRGTYDKTSIMHYNSREFGDLHFTDLNGQSINGYWGRNDLSLTDVAEWKKVYPGGGSTTYPTGTVHDGPINLRSGPGTSYSIVGTANTGEVVSIVCQTTGTSHTGPWGTTNIWDKLTTGKWISDAFVYTGSNGTVAPTCN